MPYTTNENGQQVWNGETIPASTRANIRATLAGHETRLDNLEEDIEVDSSGNVIVGDAMGSQTTATGNVAIGTSALNVTTTGSDNVAIGASALALNTTGSNNIAIGNSALSSLPSGSDNVVLGEDALAIATTAVQNVVIGDGAGATVEVVTGGVYIGKSVVPTDGATNEIAIGLNAEGGGSNTVTIGNGSTTGTYLSGTVFAPDFVSATTVSVGPVGANIRAGSAAPNGSVTGNVGDIYLRTGGGAGSTFYVKEADSGANTGWAAK